MAFTFKKFFKNHKKYQVVPVALGTIVVIGVLILGGMYAGFLKTQTYPLNTLIARKPSVTCVKEATKFILKHDRCDLYTRAFTYKGSQLPRNHVTCSDTGKVLSSGTVIDTPSLIQCNEYYGDGRPKFPGTLINVRCEKGETIYKPVMTHTCVSPLSTPAYTVSTGWGKPPRWFNYTLSCSSEGKPLIIQRGSRRSVGEPVTDSLFQCGKPPLEG